MTRPVRLSVSPDDAILHGRAETGVWDGEGFVERLPAATAAMLAGEEDRILFRQRQVIRWSIPLPPSANRLWRVMRGRPVKSAAYRDWVRAVRVANTPPPRPATWFTIAITVPATRRDPDNGIKPILDALQATAVIKDDSMLRGLTLDVTDSNDLSAIVEVFDAPPPVAVSQREEQAIRAIEAAEALLSEDYRDRLTPHAYSRALRVSRTPLSDLRPAMAAAMLRLYQRIVGART
jgi:Holliday junction resolvase RusA-like endonuclease